MKPYLCLFIYKYLYIYLVEGCIVSVLVSHLPSPLCPTCVWACCTHYWASRKNAKKLNQQANTALLQKSSAEAAWLHRRNVLPLFIVVGLEEQRCIEGEISCWGVFSPRNWDCESRLSYVSESKVCGGRLKMLCIPSSQWKLKSCCKATYGNVQEAEA